VVKAVDVPVTLKIRTGWDSGHRNAPADRTHRRVRRHPRARRARPHARQHYTGEAEYDTIAAIKAAMQHPGDRQRRHRIRRKGRARCSSTPAPTPS
jgi:tRNA-dihydrouridine synthase B